MFLSPQRSIACLGEFGPLGPVGTFTSCKCHNQLPVVRWFMRFIVEVAEKKLSDKDSLQVPQTTMTDFNY